MLNFKKMTNFTAEQVQRYKEEECEIFMVRTLQTRKSHLLVILQFKPIVNTILLAVNYYHKGLHLGCCSSPRCVSDFTFKQI